MMTPAEKCVVAFNRFLADFVKDVNKASHADLKAKNREAYSKITMCSNEYIDALIARVPRGFEDINDVEILSTATVGEISKSTGEKSIVETYSYLILAIARLYEDDPDDELVTTVLALVSKIQDNDEDIEELSQLPCPKSSPELQSMLKGMMDSRFKNSKSKPNEKSNENEPKFNFDPSMLESSMIGTIAKEVVAELDIEKVAGATSGISSVDDVLKALDGSGNAGNLIGNIVSKVGAKLQNKMANGGMNQQDLFKEAFSMFGPLMGDMMKHMPNDNSKRNMGAKDRLKKKLDERNAATQSV